MSRKTYLIVLIESYVIVIPMRTIATLSVSLNTNNKYSTQNKNNKICTQHSNASKANFYPIITCANLD